MLIKIVLLFRSLGYICKIDALMETIPVVDRLKKVETFSRLIGCANGDDAPSPDRKENPFYAELVSVSETSSA